MTQIDKLDKKGWRLAEVDKAGKVQVCLARSNDMILGIAIVDPDGGNAPLDIRYDGKVYSFSSGAGGTYIYHERALCRLCGKEGIK